MTQIAPSLLSDDFPLPLDVPFTRPAARAAGLSDRLLHRLTRDGYLRRPVRGVYVAAQVPESIELRCRMLSLVVPAGSFICDRTAAWVYAGPGALGPDEHLSVPPVSCFRPSGRRRLDNALSVSGERAILPRDLREVQGLLVTTPLRTALDLGRLGRTDDLRLHGMDLMLQLGEFEPAELLAELPRFRGERGVVGLRALAPLADPGSQSFGESALRLRWHRAGLPWPVTQVRVGRDGGASYWLDLGLPELRYAAEYDGAAWHSDPDQVAHDDARRALLRSHGWALDVFRGPDVFGRFQDAERRLQEGYAAARRSLGHRLLLV